MTELKRTISVLMLTLMSIFLVSCQQVGPDVITKDDFNFTVYPNKVYIQDLSELGKTKDAIYIPLTLNDKPVTSIGYKQLGQFHFIKSQQLTYLNLPHHTLSFTTFSGLTKLKVLVLSSTGAVKMIDSDNQLFNGESGARIYVPKGFLEAYQSLNQGIIDSQVFMEANISFMYNYEDSPNHGYYMVDFKMIDTDVYEPIHPNRPGYTFVGWYLDEATTQQYHFSNTLSTNQLSLYAKWTMNT